MRNEGRDYHNSACRNIVAAALMLTIVLCAGLLTWII